MLFIHWRTEMCKQKGRRPRSAESVESAYSVYGTFDRGEGGEREENDKNRKIPGKAAARNLNLLVGAKRGRL